HKIRDHVERPDARRLQRPRRRGHPRGRPVAGQGVTIRILGLSGSLRRDSHNTALLRAAGELLPPGDELVVWQGLRDLPHYDQDEDLDPAHPAVASLRAAVAGAD